MSEENPRHPAVEGPESPLEETRHPEEAPQQAREALTEEVAELEGTLELARAKIAELETETEEARERAEAAAKREIEVTERLQRLQADFDNFRRRSQEQTAQAAARGKEEMLNALLPVLDNLDQAMKHVEDQGLKLIGRQLAETLEQQGVTLVEPGAGDAFDAARHEAIAEEAADGIEAGNVVKVFQRGFVVGGRVMRPARVVVAAKPKSND